MLNVYEQIAVFADRERKEAQAACEREKNQVALKPDTYMAKEIKYQTALLQQLLHEVTTLKVMLINKNDGTNNVPSAD